MMTVQFWKEAKWLLFLLLCFPSSTFAQDPDSLLSMLEDMEPERIDYTIATFKGTRLGNGHSIETPAPGVLEFMIEHRFGSIGDGPSELWGLDQAFIRFGFGYGITDWLTVGVGRSNIQKTYDGYVKLKFLRQSTGKRVMPLTAVYVGGMAINTLPWQDPDRTNYYSSRLSFTHQLLLARKFSERLSIQLMPTLVHRNLVETVEDENDVWAIGVGGRFKLNGSLAVTAEYYYLLPGKTADDFVNSLTIGLDIETGGHVFQLLFTNSLGMTENIFIPTNQEKWLDGDIHFGFNLSRVFTISKKNRIPSDWN
ncbi:DUF5777 family beta-barrel protein [Pontibacter sp. G13]|uniref:DUF5777 family beta-barrel protein n=1 Tax=Pontibacter sp. G13 TaxID=3074898 RepID=UPI00288BF429|nr:DUF5777 family beta-barrel protein [Pontibacter sp. G13]WNJ18119.1 DUF5777 family beta-barrel protein [Pontibacter sp. G13]